MFVRFGVLRIALYCIPTPNLTAVIDIGYNSKYEKDMSGYYGGGFIEALLPYRYLFKQQRAAGSIHVNRMERKSIS